MGYIFAQMFRQLTAFIFLASFAVQTYNGAFILVNFYTNRAAFAKFCVNKAKPKMHCNGKCQVMKKMQEAEKKEQQNAEQKLEVQSPMLCSGSVFCFLKIPLAINIKPTVYDIDYTIRSSSSDVFHPPQALVTG